MATPTSIQPIGQHARRALAGAMLCNALEWYEFSIYGILAIYISKAFFPQDSNHTALLATFALLGVTFLVRPVGGLVIGHLGDVRGRKPALVLSVVMMSAGSLTIGLLPTYEQAGVIAPALLLCARLVQGVSVGGEWGAALSYLAEWSAEHKRGLWCSFLAASVAIGSLLASGLAALLITSLAPGDMFAWGWRIPFILGGLLGVIGFWVRVRLDETPIYNDFKSNDLEEKQTSRKSFAQGAIALGITIHWTVCYYMLLIYLPIYNQVQGKLSSAESAWSNTISLVGIVLLVPVVGALSDRYGRKPFLLASCFAIAALTIPAFVLIANCQSFAITLSVQMLFGAAIALYSGSAPALMAELFPTRSRSRLSSISYALGVAIFGGFAPFIADWLIRTVGSPLAPTAYLISAALLSATVILFTRETSFAPLTSKTSASNARAFVD